VIITSNKYDYVSVIAAVTPYKIHRSLVSKIFQVSQNDVFPTLYRANTLRALRKAFSPVLFRLGVLYERVTSLRMFRSLLRSIFCVFEKTPVKVPVSTGEPAPSERIGAL
jgi:hypothetical protein